MIQWMLNPKNGSNQSPCTFGEVSVKILASEQSGVVIRSDVDMTYLETPLHSTYSLIKLVKQKGSQRKKIDGISLVYQLLQNSHTITSQEVKPRPLSFLSGSPHFFTRSLLARFQIDKLQVNGLVLKPFKNIVSQGLKRFNFKKIKRALKTQIGFKLESLLMLRRDLPNLIQEILIGDNTESDPMIYMLYHKITSGLMTLNALSHQLSELGLNSTWRDRVLIQAQSVLKSRPPEKFGGAVRAIFIHRAKQRLLCRESSVQRGTTFQVKSLSNTPPSYLYCNAKELAEALYQTGLLSRIEKDQIQRR